jgi:hypothetical protein
MAVVITEFGIVRSARLYSKDGSIPADEACIGNWFKLDPWFMTRNIQHLQHPKSPLSSDTLVQDAFFSQAFPLDEARQFAQRMTKYDEALYGCVEHSPEHSRTWHLNASRILVMPATEDKLMAVRLMENLAGEYRAGIKRRNSQQKVKAAKELPTRSRISDHVKQDLEAGSAMVVFQGAGHHMQKKGFQAVEAEEALKKFLE